MRAEETTRRTVTTLREVLRQAGRGSMHRAAQHAGLSKGYFSNWLWGSGPPGWAGLKLRTLCSALEIADIEPGDFFARAFPSPDPVALFMRDANRLARRIPVPRTVEIVRQRFLRLTIQDIAGDAGEVEDLERLRQRQPQKALRRAADLARKTECANLAAGALGVWASVAGRNVTKLDEATVILGTGIEVAERYEIKLVTARLMLRSASLLALRTEFDRGLASAEWSLIRYSEDGDDVGVGLAHYMRGLMLGYVGEYEAAIKAFRRALVHLPVEPHLMGGAWQCLGFLYHKQGQLTEAEQALQKARELLAGEMSAEAEGYLVYACAQVSEARGNFIVADRLYSKALELLAEAEIWIETALIAAEKARLLVRFGNAKGAQEFAAGLRWLVIPLERASPQAAAAFCELIREATEARNQLTLDRLNRIIGGIGRSQASARSKKTFCLAG